MQLILRTILVIVDGDGPDGLCLYFFLIGSGSL